MIRRYQEENVYEALQKRLHLLLQEFDNIYVSFSGGKDSMFFEDESFSEKHFSDVEEDAWYYSYSNVMYEKSIMVGSDGCFYPYEPVTYLEAMKIIKRLGGKDVEYEKRRGYGENSLRHHQIRGKAYRQQGGNYACP